MKNRPAHLVLRLSWPLFSLMACVPADPPSGPRKKPDSAPRVGASKPALPRASTGRTAKRAASAAPRSVEPPAADGAVLGEPYQDDFSRETLGPGYRPTSPAWRIDAGRLCGQGARNRPVWLAQRLPRNARIEFDAVSSSPDGDIKVEAWGDGRSGATGVSYDDATSYLFVFGGWKNTLHVLARLDEHGADRQEIRLDPESDDPRNQPVEPNRTYHFRIERRDGKTVRWYADDVELATFRDPAPLAGAGHEHFGFNDWEAPVCFDNLDILPLD